MKIHKTLAPGIQGMHSFSLTEIGLHEYAEAWIDDYEQVIHRVIAELVNHEPTGDREIADALSQPRQLIENILDLLELRGLLKCSKTTGPHTHVFWVSPELRLGLGEGVL